MQDFVLDRPFIDKEDRHRDVRDIFNFKDYKEAVDSTFSSHVHIPLDINALCTSF